MIVNSFQECETRNKCEVKTMKEYNIYARIPSILEISDYVEDKNNEYLYDNLSIWCADDNGVDTTCEDATQKQGVDLFSEKISHMSIVGYITSSYYSGGIDIITIEYNGLSSIIDVNYSEWIGIRPVITLKF